MFVNQVLRMIPLHGAKLGNVSDDKMRLLKIIVPALLLCALAANSKPVFGGSANTPMNDSTKPASKDGVAPADTIAPGTEITMDNWRNYRQFMPDGMVALFEGKYVWKMPPGVRIQVGPTVIRPLPKNYMEATEKYSNQVHIIELPDGGLTLKGYRGGIPFPNLSEPHKGWKALANVWYRYVPHLVVDFDGYGCAIDGRGSINCQTYQAVKRQLSYNTDPGVVSDVSGEGKFFTEWYMTLEPEQYRYTTILTIDYANLARAEEMYVFLPSLRRYQPLSTAARCAPSQGMDATPEDFHNGFDSNMTELQVDYLGRKKILALVDPNPPRPPFPQGYEMPLGWPTPDWGKWQVRDVDVISIQKIPSKAAGYCYGRRVMYADSHFHGTLWEDLYDSQMRLWKIQAIFPLAVDVPGVGRVETAASDVEELWDVQNNHATIGAEPTPGRPFYVNEQAPKEFSDLPRYTTPSGLNLIMR
jgi:uncharacterized protein DUF1329